MKYLRINNGQIEYPFRLATIKAENPNTSFPKEMSDALLADYNIFPVKPTERPVVDGTQIVIEIAPILIDGVWTQQFEIRPAPVPKSITPRQCRLLLLQQGLLEQVEAMISQASNDVKITWEYALEFRRDDPLLNQLAANLSPPLTDEQIDQFFFAASEL